MRTKHFPHWLKGGLLAVAFAFIFLGLCYLSILPSSHDLMMIFGFPLWLGLMSGFLEDAVPWMNIVMGILLTALLYFGIGAGVGAIYGRMQRGTVGYK